jgi:hypothetical protein
MNTQKKYTVIAYATMPPPARSLYRKHIFCEYIKIYIYANYSGKLEMMKCSLGNCLRIWVCMISNLKNEAGLQVWSNFECSPWARLPRRQLSAILWWLGCGVHWRCAWYEGICAQKHMFFFLQLIISWLCTSGTRHLLGVFTPILGRRRFVYGCFWWTGKIQHIFLDYK